MLDPVAALEVLLVVHRPVFVEREIQGFGRHGAAGKVGEGRAIQERTEAGVPRGPVERAVRTELRRGGDTTAPSVSEDIERQAMLMGEAEPRTFLLHHPVAVHLGDERELVGQGEVPDVDEERYVLSVEAQHAAVFAGLGVLGNLEFEETSVRRGLERVDVCADLGQIVTAVR